MLDILYRKYSHSETGEVVVMPTTSQEISNVCPRFHRAVELIGRRWTGVILSSMLHGTTRFTDIANSVPGLSDRLLSERLKELECQGIVERNVHAEAPIRIEYTMTTKGLALADVINAIGGWAEVWDDAPVHDHELAAERNLAPV